MTHNILDHRLKHIATRVMLITLAAWLFVVVLAGCSSPSNEEATQGASASQVVNVYSARHYGAVEQVFTRFTEETGIEVRLSQGSAQSLIERILAEGPQSPADAIITIDAGGLQLLADEGVLQPVESELLQANIPELLRDPQNRWFALSQRVRTIVYNPAAVSADEAPATYADLADPRWQGRLCLRPATHIYTIGLVANMIVNEGEAGTEEIVRGWVANNPTYINSDSRQLETVAAGGCDVTLVNHYYLAQLLAENPDFPVTLVWANQETTGVHRNITGMGVLQSARNLDNAVTLLEWLASEGQGATPDTLPGSNFEFPANPEAEVHPIIAGFGDWQVDPVDLSEYGTNQAAAIQLLERAGYGFDETATQ